MAPRAMARALITVAVLSAMGTSGCAPAAAPSASDESPSHGTSAAPPAAPDLSGDLVWFAPLPPLSTGPGRPFIGSDDFMDLFAPGAEWPDAAAGIQVFKLYGEWVGSTSDADLRTAVQAIRERGLALAVEMGPLDATAECGADTEGFAGSSDARDIARRISDAGGRLDLVAMDEPFYYGSVYDGPHACHWDAPTIASKVSAFVDIMRGYFPDVLVGDTEPTPPPTDVGTYTGWIDAFRDTNGYDLAFLHLDIDWNRDSWAADAAAIAGHGEKAGVPVGVIFAGNGTDPTDAQWVATAGERVKTYLATAGAPPRHVLFQSWVDHPDRVLPESDPSTFTGLVRQYLADPSALGFTDEMRAANLALGATVTASAAEAGSPPEQAIDGDWGTLWNSGADPVQWIEIALAAPSTVTSVTLIPAQYPAGPTVHRVSVFADGAWEDVATFDGETSDGSALHYDFPSPRPRVERVRVTTDSSPAWVAWYEVEIAG